MRRTSREKLAQAVADWRHEGLIDATTAATLEQRYGVSVTMGQVLLRWLGFYALFLLGSSLLGVVGMALGEAALFLAPIVVGGVAWVLWSRGVRLATDPANRYPVSGSVLLTAGLVGALGTLALGYQLVGGTAWGDAMPTMMLLVAAGSVATAYRFGLRWPLGLGLLLAFHALGSWHGYRGSGSYVLQIHDPRTMAVAGLAVAAFGAWHEHRLEEQRPRLAGLGSLYLVLGLLYANLSLWILSIRPGGIEWVLAFTALAIAQVALGAGRRDGRITGFGVVFLGIDLYTRFFETFWDELSRGAFFFLAGVAALAFGALCERQRQGGDA